MESIVDQILEEAKERMAKAVEKLKQELSAIRTSQANPSFIEGVMVNVYGTKMRIKDLATITMSSARQLLVTPFDAQNVVPVSQAVDMANLGLTSQIDKNMVRVNFPMIDAKVREKYSKMCKTKCEESKIQIRNARRDANEGVRAEKKSGSIGEDIMKKLEKQIQDLTDKFCKEAEEISLNKEKELKKVA